MTDEQTTKYQQVMARYFERVVDLFTRCCSCGAELEWHGDQHLDSEYASTSADCCGWNYRSCTRIVTDGEPLDGDVDTLVDELWHGAMQVDCTHYTKRAESHAVLIDPGPCDATSDLAPQPNA